MSTVLSTTSSLRSANRVQSAPWVGHVGMFHGAAAPLRRKYAGTNAPGSAGPAAGGPSARPPSRSSVESRAVSQSSSKRGGFPGTVSAWLDTIAQQDEMDMGHIATPFDSIAEWGESEEEEEDSDSHHPEVDYPYDVCAPIPMINVSIATPADTVITNSYVLSSKSPLTRALHRPPVFQVPTVVHRSPIHPVPSGSVSPVLIQPLASISPARAQTPSRPTRVTVGGTNSALLLHGSPMRIKQEELSFAGDLKVQHAELHTQHTLPRTFSMSKHLMGRKSPRLGNINKPMSRRKLLSRQQSTRLPSASAQPWKGPQQDGAPTSSSTARSIPE